MQVGKDLQIGFGYGGSGFSDEEALETHELKPANNSLDSDLDHLKKEVAESGLDEVTLGKEVTFFKVIVVPIETVKLEDLYKLRANPDKAKYHDHVGTTAEQTFGQPVEGSEKAR